MALILSNQAFAAEDTLTRLGVLAKRGPEQCPKQWKATADYLTDALPSKEFVIVPLSFDEIEDAVANKRVEFILTNPAIYVKLELLWGVTRIATMINTHFNRGLTSFGGVIFTRADSEIHSFNDLEGKRFAAVNELSFGGWLMAHRELLPYLPNDLKSFNEMIYSGTHDAVVMAVLEGRVDAGTVRTDTLERMEFEGLIDMDDFRVLTPEGANYPLPHFPFKQSTALYPEWPMAKLQHTPERLARQVASALFAMPENCEAAQDALVVGWTIPMNYQPVHDLLKDLKVAPYDHFGEISLGDVIHQHWVAVALATILLFTAVTFSLFLYGLNRKLLMARKQTERELIRRKNEEGRRKDVENMVRHELNSPAISILSGLKVLRMSDNMDDEQRKLLNMSITRAKSMLEVISLNQALSQMEAGTHEMENDQVSLREVAERTVAEISDEATARGIKIACNLGTAGERMIVLGDMLLLTIMVRNALANAIQASPSGFEVTMTLTNKQGVEFRVSNKGEVPEEIRDEFFDKYVTQGKATGTGLGTYLIKLIAESHGGTAFVDTSQPGRTIVGARFPTPS